VDIVINLRVDVRGPEAGLGAGEGIGGRSGSPGRRSNDLW
jgi:hypothetical protein